MTTIIGKGDAGIVYRPPFEGFPAFQTDESYENFVSKVFERPEDPDAASCEVAAANLLRERLGDDVANYFILLPLHFYKTSEGDEALVYRYGGKSIYHYRRRQDSKQDVLVALMNLLPFLRTMNLAGICHGDIFGANIVYDEIKRKCYVIDLEKVKDFTAILEEEDRFWKSRSKPDHLSEKKCQEIYNRDISGLARCVFDFLELNYKDEYRKLGFHKLNNSFLMKKDIPPAVFYALIEEMFETIRNQLNL